MPDIGPEMTIATYKKVPEEKQHNEEKK